MNKAVIPVLFFFCFTVFSAAWAAPYSFYGKTYKLKVDREVKNPQTVLPLAELNENYYTKLENVEVRYTVSISKSGEKITIEGGEKTMTGVKYKTEKKMIYYQLTNGVFAGGRFIIRQQKNELNAELTIYGSGFPVIASERGVLVF
jgi:hypothetical protein